MRMFLSLQIAVCKISSWRPPRRQNKILAKPLEIIGIANLILRQNSLEKVELLFLLTSLTSTWIIWAYEK